MACEAHGRNLCSSCRVPLRRGGGLQRGAPLRRGRRKKVADPVTPEVYTAVMVRGAGCEVGKVAGLTRACDDGRLRWHHRLPREHGGRSTVPNGLVACERHHAWIHAHPAVAMEFGWLVDRRTDPASVAVQVPGRSRRVLLTADGDYRHPTSSDRLSLPLNESEAS